MFVGILASTSYLLYCRRQNAARASGSHDETLLSDSPLPGEDHEGRVQRARQMRRERVQELKAQGFRGRIKAIYADLDEGPGGVYADVDEARRMKGDAWSGFRKCEGLLSWLRLTSTPQTTDTKVSAGMIAEE